MKITKFYSYIFLSIVALGSCKKKQYTCSYSIQYLSPAISFVGFSENEVRDFKIERYKAGSNFTELISTDIFTETTIEYRGDTAYRIFQTPYYPSGFSVITSGIDYKIISETGNKEFLITDVESGPETKTWTQDTYCSMGSSQVRISTLSFKLNGVNSWPGSFPTNNFFIYLRR